MASGLTLLESATTWEKPMTVEITSFPLPTYTEKDVGLKSLIFLHRLLLATYILGIYCLIPYLAIEIIVIILLSFSFGTIA